MYSISSLKKQSYKVHEAAKILNVSTKTIRNYDAQGILHAERTVGNHRAIPREEIIRFLNEKGLLIDDTSSKKRDVIYARVSSHDHKNHDGYSYEVTFCQYRT